MIKNKKYYLHFLLMMLLVSSMLGVGFYNINHPLLWLLFLLSMVYFIIFFLGAWLRMGPLQSIGVEIITNYENEKNELKPRQPWE